MSASFSPWRSLELHDPSIPRLLVRYGLDDVGYSIQLTDLSRVWAEALDRHEVIERARDIGCSIDPSEDDDQFKILLDKIKSVLVCENDTSIAIQSSESGEDLHLALTGPLPRPLPPFEWTMNLQRQPAWCIQSALVDPLVQQVSKLKIQMRQLISELHDKDRVISKITDRLETSGNDLTTVFPGVANIKTNRKRSQRDQLAKHIKGLADFNDAAWKEQGLNFDAGKALESEGLNEVLADLPLDVYSKADSPAQTDWLEALDDGKKIPATSLLNSKAHSANEALAEMEYHTIDEGDNKQDNDFQRQSTPPPLKKHTPVDSGKPDNMALRKTEKAGTSLEEADDGSTTEDDDDLDAAPANSAELRSSPPHPPRESPTSPRLSQTAANQKIPEDEDNPPAPKSRGKLGVIGGKRPAPASPEHSQSPPSPQKPPTRSKLGMIGGKSNIKASKDPVVPREPSPALAKTHGDDVRATTEADNSSSPSLRDTFVKQEPDRMPRAQQKTEPDAPRQTSQERADEKRDRLKRELEAKSKTTAKKKRKF